MSIVIPPELETRLRAHAEAEGLTVEAYIERLVSADERAEAELINLALEGLGSGEPLKVGPTLHKKYIVGAHRAPLQLRTPSCRGGL